MRIQGTGRHPQWEKPNSPQDRLCGCSARTPKICFVLCFLSGALFFFSQIMHGFGLRVFEVLQRFGGDSFDFAANFYTDLDALFQQRLPVKR